MMQVVRELSQQFSCLTHQTELSRRDMQKEVSDKLGETAANRLKELGDTSTMSRATFPILSPRKTLLPVEICPQWGLA
jgi:hypothetical protein